MTITKPACFSNQFFRCIGIFSAVLLLGACSYFDTSEPSGADQIDLTHGSVHSGSQNTIGAGYTPDLVELANRTSSGSVQIFSLDAADSAGSSYDSVGIVSDFRTPAARSMSPNVQLFPLDDEMGRVIAPSLYPRGDGPAAPVLPVEPRPIVPATAVQQHSSAAPAFTPVTPSLLVYFDHDQTGVSNSGSLSEIAQGVRGNEKIKVSGYASRESSIADPTARKIVNLRVAMERAFSVAKSLIERGVPVDNIEIAAFGEAGAAAAGSEQSAARRVEITVQ